MHNGIILGPLIRIPTDAASSHAMLLWLFITVVYLLSMAWQVGTGRLVVLLVHTYLVQLVVIQLVHLHFLNLAARVDGRWSITALHHLDTTNLLTCILAPIQASQLVCLLIRVTTLIGNTFAGGYISSGDRWQLLRVILLGGHLLLMDHGLHGALWLPGRVKNPLVIRHITGRRNLWLIQSLHLNRWLL